MNTKINENTSVSTDQTVYVLQHMETREYICLRQDAKEFLACFTDGDTGRQFRSELGLNEFVDIASLHIGAAPFDNFWLDGEMIGRSVLASPAHAVSRF